MAVVPDKGSQLTCYTLQRNNTDIRKQVNNRSEQIFYEQ